MNVLYISTVFPKIGESSTIYTDLAEELVKKGHNLTIVAAEEKKKSKGTKIGLERGCKVLRVNVGNMYDVNIIEKCISIVTLEWYMKKALKKYLKREAFDFILFEAPPVTLSGVVEVAKKIYKAPAFLMMKDIFPQNAVDIGMMKKGGIVYKFFKAKEKKLYFVADNIGCMSEGNRKYLHEHNNIPFRKLSIFPNTKKIRPKPEKNLMIREKYNIPRDKRVFVFGGNMGKPQGLDFLLKAIKEAEIIDKAFFVLVGRGTERKKVVKAFQNSKNALILDNLPRSEYEELISSCDIGIVCLDARFTIPNFPSRILSYMEYGMPVLAATDKNTDFKNLIKEAACGYWCESNDLQQFVKYVSDFCDDEDIEKMGLNGRKYLEDNYPVTRSVELLENFYHEKK